MVRRGGEGPPARSGSLDHREQHQNQGKGKEKNLSKFSKKTKKKKKPKNGGEKRPTSFHFRAQGGPRSGSGLRGEGGKKRRLGKKKEECEVGYLPARGRRKL